jgi:adenine-specific DNA methylase
VHWQEEGLIPEMPIEPGDETTRLGRERGWTHWPHLFNPRQLLLLQSWIAQARKNSNFSALAINLARCLDNSSRLTRWDSGVGQDRIANTFSNQALNTTSLDSPGAKVSNLVRCDEP